MALLLSAKVSVVTVFLTPNSWFSFKIQMNSAALTSNSTFGLLFVPQNFGLRRLGQYCPHTCPCHLWFWTPWWFWYSKRKALCPLVTNGCPCYLVRHFKDGGALCRLQLRESLGLLLCTWEESCVPSLSLLWTWITVTEGCWSQALPQHQPPVPSMRWSALSRSLSSLHRKQNIYLLNVRNGHSIFWRNDSALREQQKSKVWLESVRSCKHFQWFFDLSSIVLPRWKKCIFGEQPAVNSKT